jgi:hypothetical protein
MVESESNLSQMVNNLSNLSELGNYTLNIIENTNNLTENKQTKPNVNSNNRQEKPLTTDLNQAFTKDSQSDSIIDSSNTKCKSFSLTLEENLKDSQFTNQKLSTQLTDFPQFEASNISNKSLTSSTQLPHLGVQTRENRKTTTNLSPVKETISTIRTRSKSAIKITPLNEKKGDKILANEQSQKETLARNVEVMLISSDDDDDEDDKETSKEISEDESENSLNLKKSKSNDEQSEENVLNPPDVSPVQKINTTGDHLCSIIMNTVNDKSENITSNVSKKSNHTKEDELMILDKDEDDIIVINSIGKSDLNKGKNFNLAFSIQFKISFCIVKIDIYTVNAVQLIFMPSTRAC